MIRTSLLVGVAAVAVAVAGCGQGTDATHAAKAEPAAASPEAPAVESPKAAVSLPVAADSAPDAVVAAFLNALREGDEAVAEALLTSIARAETTKHELEVRPPGTPSASYEVGAVQLVQGGAHVSCVWSEPAEDGGRVAYDLVWVLRQQPDGWRIAGMATELVLGQPPVFLNFEDLADMFQKAEQAEAMLAAEAEEPAATNAAAPTTPATGQQY